MIPQLTTHEANKDIGMSSDDVKWSSQKEINELIAPYVHSNRWNISTRKISQQDVQHIFQRIRRPENVQYLWLHWNKMPKITKLIIQPYFNKVIILNIGGNNIVSIEPLSTLQMPTLQQFFLWNNEISRLRCLRKMLLPNLKYIDLSHNKITIWQKFSEMQSNSIWLINLQDNPIADINYFIKNIDMQMEQQCTINILHCQLVKIFKKIAKKGKKKPKVYYFKKWELERL